MASEIIILGDLNLDWTRQDKFKLWTTFLIENHLKQLITEPTRITSSTQTIIDHIYTTHEHHSFSARVLPLSLSDHYLILFTRKLNTDRVHTPSQLMTYRSWKDFKSGPFLLDLNSIQWDALLLNNPASAMELFQTQFQGVVDTHLPLKRKHVKSKRLPLWLDDEVRALMTRRDQLKRSGDSLSYKAARNLVTNIIKKKKRAAIRHMCLTSGNTKALWATVLNKSSNVVDINYLETAHGTLREGNSIVNALNNHFTDTTAQSDAEDISDPILPVPSPYKITVPCPHLTPIYPRDIVSFIGSLHDNKATGPDNLSAKLLKIALPVVIAPLTFIFNYHIQCGSFPDVWKIARVRPVPKQSSCKNPSDFRPISILPILSKLLEKHILKNLTCHFNRNGIISKFQSGFRKAHSCETAVQHMYSSWLSARESEKHTGVVLVDLSKAFDSIDHSILISKLNWVGLPSSTLALLTSFFSNRRQYVFNGNINSSVLSISKGVPQGSLLGPLLVSFYINDLFMLETKSTLHSYADDTTLFFSHKNTEYIHDVINTDLSKLEKWLSKNKLSVNIKKSQFLFIPTLACRMLDFQPPQMCGIPLTSSKCVSLLGFKINSSLSWSDHIEYVISKTSQSLNLFKHIRYYLNTKFSRTFYYNFIHSYLTRGLVLYYSCSPKNVTDTLFKIQKRALRIISNVFLSDHIRSDKLFSSHKILPLPSLCEYHSNIMGHKVIMKCAPLYLLDLFPDNRYRLSRHKTLPSSRSYNRFEMKVVVGYNSLPKTIRALSLQSFKPRLKASLLTELLQ